MKEKAEVNLPGGLRMDADTYIRSVLNRDLRSAELDQILKECSFTGKPIELNKETEKEEVSNQIVVIKGNNNGIEQGVRSSLLLWKALLGKADKLTLFNMPRSHTFTIRQLGELQLVSKRLLSSSPRYKEKFSNTRLYDLGFGLVNRLKAAGFVTRLTKEDENKKMAVYTLLEDVERFKVIAQQNFDRSKKAKEYSARLNKFESPTSEVV